MYPNESYEADLTPTFPKHIDEACNAIYKACKGFGTDEKSLTETFGPLTARDRWLLAKRYPDIYDGKDLYKLIKSETSGNWGTLVQYLACTPEEAECHMIRKATHGIGTTEKILYPIMCGRSNKDMEVLKKAYYRLYNQDLVVLMTKELGGNLKQLVVNCAQGVEEAFDPGFHTEDKAEEDAEAFYKAGQGKWGTDEKKLFHIISFSPPKHLEAVNQKYVEKYGYSLSKALDKELSRTVKKAALYALGMKLKPYETMAEEIKRTCAGIGTDELGLTCCMVRFQEFMPQVLIAHEELFEKTVNDRIRSEVSGKFQKLLLALTGIPEM